MDFIEGNFHPPSLVMIPSSEIMITISIATMVIGLFLVILGLILQKKKTNRAAWVCMGIGALLIINHGIQLLFRVF